MKYPIKRSCTCFGMVLALISLTVFGDFTPRILFSGSKDTEEYHLSELLEESFRKFPKELLIALPPELLFTFADNGNEIEDPNELFGWLNALTIEGIQEIKVPPALRKKLTPLKSDRIFWQRALLAVFTKLAAPIIASTKNFDPYLRLLGIIDGRQLNKSYPFNPALPRPQNLIEGLSFDVPMLVSDPQFFCMRPATFELINRALALDLKRPTTCKPFTRIPLLSYTQNILKAPSSVDLLPEEIVEVAYVKVEESNARLSHFFGHALLRITACAPGIDPKRCRGELVNQYLISYRAVDPILERSSAFFKSKDLRGFLMKYRDILLEYVSKDDRDLEIFPLKLTKQQIELLIFAYIEKLHTDDKNYNLASFNCATAAADLINIAVGSDNPIQTFIEIPKLLIGTLEDRGLLDEENYELVEASSKVVSKHLQALRKIAPEVKLSYSKLQKQTFKEREKKWNIIFDAVKGTEQYQETLINVSEIETIMMRLNEANAARKVNAGLKRAVTNSGNEDEQKLIKLFMERNDLMQSRVNLGFNYRSYGLPSDKEVLFTTTPFDAVSIAQDGINNIVSRIISQEEQENKQIEAFNSRCSEILMENFWLKI